MPSIFGQLREILLNEFTEAEVKMLCDRMGIDFEDLAGTGLFGKTRELLLVTQQQNRLPQLLAHMRVMQPQAFDDYDQADLATAAEFDSLIDARPSREPSSEKDVPFTDVARETEQSYVVTPQTRLPFLIALIAAIVILGALIVFLPVLLNQNRASGVQTSVEPTSAAADATVQAGTGQPIRASLLHQVPLRTPETHRQWLESLWLPRQGPSRKYQSYPEELTRGRPNPCRRRTTEPAHIQPQGQFMTQM